MTKFSDKSWEERKEILGGPAEDAFKRYAERHKIQYDRYGFDNSPIKKFAKLPEFVRNTPDFACVGKTSFLVECKGTGRGSSVNLKESVVDPLIQWNIICPVFIFFYDSDKHKVSMNSLTSIVQNIHIKGYEKGEWVDWGVAKPYFKIPKSHLVWEDDDGEA